MATAQQGLRTPRGSLNHERVEQDGKLIRELLNQPSGEPIRSMRFTPIQRHKSPLQINTIVTCHKDGNLRIACKSVVTYDKLKRFGLKCRHIVILCP